MRWFVTNDSYRKRTIWRGEEPPFWDRLQSCWRKEGGHFASEQMGGRLIIEALWPHVGGPAVGEIVEIAPPAVLTPLELARKGE